MNTLVTVNVGLETKEGNRLDVHRALHAIAACGVSIATSAVVNGEWEGKAEPCLFIQGFIANPRCPVFRQSLALASDILCQHCLAIYFDGRGELIGKNPEGWRFDPELFHFHPEGKRAEKTPPEIDGWESSGHFVAYLEGVLIPDLKESGLNATAQDFETAVKFIRG